MAPKRRAFDQMPTNVMHDSQLTTLIRETYEPRPAERSMVVSDSAPTAIYHAVDPERGRWERVTPPAPTPTLGALPSPVLMPTLGSTLIPPLAPPLEPPVVASRAADHEDDDDDDDDDRSPWRVRTGTAWMLALVTLAAVGAGYVSRRAPRVANVVHADVAAPVAGTALAGTGASSAPSAPRVAKHARHAPPSH